MLLRLIILGACVGGLIVSGCATGTFLEQNPFLTLAEEYGISGGVAETQEGAASGSAVSEIQFRRDMTVTFTNLHDNAELDFSYAAWVNVGSIRSADQQDALLRDGYVQLTGDQVAVGSAYTLPVGTFVYNGPGLAGATAVRIPYPGEVPETEEATRSDYESVTINLITPDVFLVFSQPPVSCDSVAFSFLNTRGGAVSGPQVGTGGHMTLAKVNVYECDPLRPGLFMKVGGGTREPNEYFEGANVLFDFGGTPDDDGFCAWVTIEDE